MDAALLQRAPLGRLIFLFFLGIAAMPAAASGAKPGWNFHKYLVDRKGAKAWSYDTAIEPSDWKLVKEIERMLAEKGDPK